MELNKEFFEEQGYQNVRQLPDGSWAGTIELMFTRAICTGLDYHGWAYRWCFENRDLANVELAKLESFDDEPKGWVARR